MSTGEGGADTSTSGDAEAARPGPLPYTTSGVSSGAAATEGTTRTGWFGNGGGSGNESAATTSQPNLIPMGLAAVTPFLTLLGKRVKEKAEER